MKVPGEIRVRLFGGLGNQFFQYFAGLDISNSRKLHLKIDARWIEDSYSHKFSDIRDFKFINSVSVVTQKNSGSLCFMLERLKTFFAAKSNLASSLFGLHSPKHPGYVPVINVKSSIELRGYYQTYKYYENALGNFNNQDWSLNSESNIFLDKRSFLTAQPFIALHVRGGDYLKNVSLYHQLDSKYYLDSLSHLRIQLGNLRVFVFSDEIAYAKNLLKTIVGIEFLDQEGLRASESMILMSLAEGLIIANSTFSYWSAILSDGCVVVAPRKWYISSEISEGFYPPEWKVN